MNKVDYNLKMEEIIQGLDNKPKLLLHSCCGPCSSSVIERIKNNFEITVIYYNPNIYPEEEYLLRKSEQIKLLEILNINYMDCDYNENEFLNYIQGLEFECEGGARCVKCFELRLNYTAKMGAENNYEYFGTTLTVSPHKNAQFINILGEKIQEKHKINYLYSDFKKKNGYLNSIKLSEKYSLYRQNYCGCRFSLNGENNGKNKKEG